MTNEPIQLGLTIALILGDPQPCGCCYEVTGRSAVALDESADDLGINAQISSLVSHVGMQLTLILKGLNPELSDQDLNNFLAKHLAQGVKIALCGGAQSHA